MSDATSHNINAFNQTRLGTTTRYLSLIQSLFVASQTPLRQDVVLDHLGASFSSSNATNRTTRVLDDNDHKHEPSVSESLAKVADSSSIYSAIQCPELVYLFLQDISRLPNCHLYPSSTCTLPRRNAAREQHPSQELMSRYASHGNITPPCSSTDHEAWLLTEAGTWRWNKYPIHVVGTSLVQDTIHTRLVPWNWKWNSDADNSLFYAPLPSYLSSGHYSGNPIGHSRGNTRGNPIPYIEIDMPECENGNTCVAKTLQIRGLPRHTNGLEISRGQKTKTQGISLCKYMYKDEWNRLPYIMPSAEPRPCLLCYWFYSTRLVINAWSHPGLQVDHANFFQLHYNLVDEIGGYKKQHMLYPLREQYLGFAHPLVHFQQEMLFAYKDEELNKWRISCKSMTYADTTATMQAFDKTELELVRPETPSGYELSSSLSNMQIDSDMD